MQKEIPNGVAPDARPAVAKAKDWKHVSSGLPLVWKEFTPDDLKLLTSQRFQDGSSSCVFQAAASALEALTGKVISATPYFWRKNYPDAGSYLQDAGDVFYNRFTTTEALSTSQNQSEAQMNQLKQLTTFLGITGYRQPAVGDIDQIAEAIDQYKQCILTYNSNGLEYSNPPMYTPKFLGVKLTDANGNFLPGSFGHGLCGQLYRTVNGVKTIICRDSCTPNGVTFITEDFHKNRNTGCLYFLGSKDVSVNQDQINAVKSQILVLALKIIALLQAKIASLKK